MYRSIKQITAFGNPLLDTVVNLSNNFLLHKYNLKEDGQKEVSEYEMNQLSKDIASLKVQISAGGCAQNTLRVLKWLLNNQCQAFIFGSVGKDDEALVLKNIIEQDGVHTRYIQQEDLRTGKTIALVNGHNRFLVAHIGAAEHLPLNVLLSQELFISTIESSNFVYIEGFFLTNRIESAKYIMDYCNKNNKVVIFNICGDYLFQIIPETVQYFVENADVVFGNKTEFEALQNYMKFKDIDEVTRHLIKNRKNRLPKYGNIVVITDGPNPVKCIYENRKCFVYETPKIEIVDTTGAGDAFAGGFIAGLCLLKDIDECLKIACYAAMNIIKQTGCVLPNFQPNIL